MRYNRMLNLSGVLVAIAAILFIVGIVFAAIRSGRRNADRQMCQSHLRAIGQSILLYANENRGAYPRTRATAQPPVTPVWGTGVEASDPFAEDGPAPNDISAALFLIARTQDMTMRVFTCPSSTAVKDDFGGPGGSAMNRSNFSDVTQNLSYSYQNPYESDAEIKQNLKWIGSVNADFALASDMNPGTAGANDDVLGVTVTSPASDMKRANSNNHDESGQNVLYADGHVEFQTNPFAGVTRDNIFTARAQDDPTAPPRYLVAAPPFDHNDSILLPTDD